MLSLLWMIPVFALDRVSKLFLRSFLARGPFVLIPGVLSLTYAQNTGMAFSFLSEHTGLLTVLSALLLAAMTVCFMYYLPRTRLCRSLIGVFVGGALGNLYDRVFYGYVIDFIELLFVRFAIFNVADIAVVIAGGALIALLVFTEDKVREPGK